jgi:hypothetical protein
MPSSTTARRTPKRRSPARRGGRRTDNWWPLAIVAAIVVVGVAWARSADDIPQVGLCTMPSTTLTLTAEQALNATTIARVGRDRGLPDRAVVLALATAQQESGLRNLPYGDRDSLGLFQQRPSQGWGTPAQVRDPGYAAGEFYERLVQVPRWKTRRLTDVAQSVQRSGFPELYQQWEPMARALNSALDDDGELTLRCR